MAVHELELQSNLATVKVSFSLLASSLAAVVAIDNLSLSSRLIEGWDMGSGEISHAPSIIRGCGL